MVKHSYSQLIYVPIFNGDRDLKSDRKGGTHSDSDIKSNNIITQTKVYLEKQKPQDEDKTDPTKLSCHFDRIVCLQIIDSQHRSGETHPDI